MCVCVCVCVCTYSMCVSHGRKMYLHVCMSACLLRMYVNYMDDVFHIRSLIHCSNHSHSCRILLIFLWAGTLTQHKSLLCWTPPLSSCSPGALQSFTFYWAGDMQFTLDLMNQFLEDMEAYSIVSSPHTPPLTTA